MLEEQRERLARKSGGRGEVGRVLTDQGEEEGNLRERDFDHKKKSSAKTFLSCLRAVRLTLNV